MSAKTRDRAQRRRAAREQAQRRERAQLRAAELEVLARRRRLEEEAKRKRESFPRRLLLSNALVEAYRDGQMTELKDMLDDDEPNQELPAPWPRMGCAASFGFAFRAASARGKPWRASSGEMRL